MKKKEDRVSYPRWKRPLRSVITEMDNFDPLGSYTGYVPDLGEIPVQDADDL